MSEANTCPKCGAELYACISVAPRHWKCDSKQYEGGTHIQSSSCRIRELEQQLAAVSAERDALAKVVERLTDGMDWAGGDAYGMPECPWCGAEPNEAQAFHAPNCTLIEARKILAAAEAAKAKEGM